MSTTMAKKGSVQQDWYVTDGDGQIVGRFASALATILMGKHKAAYTPHVDTGDYVIVLNVDRVRFTGNELAHPKHPYYTTKMDAKTYDRYSGYPGGRTVEPAIRVWERFPERILREAVRRMLPKNKLGRQMLKKLKLYTGTEHPHQGQSPAELPAYLLPKQK